MHQSDKKRAPQSADRPFRAVGRGKQLRKKQDEAHVPNEGGSFDATFVRRPKVNEQSPQAPTKDVLSTETADLPYSSVAETPDLAHISASPIFKEPAKAPAFTPDFAPSPQTLVRDDILKQTAFRPPQKVEVPYRHPQWLYRDPSGHIQGPFSPTDMQEWMNLGFFTDDLSIKRVMDPDFISLSRFKLLYGPASPFMSEAQESQRLAFLRGQDSMLPVNPVSAFHPANPLGLPLGNFPPYDPAVASVFQNKLPLNGRDHLPLNSIGGPALPFFGDVRSALGPSLLDQPPVANRWFMNNEPQNTQAANSDWRLPNNNPNVPPPSAWNQLNPTANPVANDDWRLKDQVPVAPLKDWNSLAVEAKAPMNDWKGPEPVKTEDHVVSDITTSFENWNISKESAPISSAPLSNPSPSQFSPAQPSAKSPSPLASKPQAISSATAPVAPWAAKPQKKQAGASFSEIQELERRKKEEVEAQKRLEAERRLMEEIARGKEAEQALASLTRPLSGPWAKPAVKMVGQRSLTDIMQEEEEMKRTKQVESKRYAETTVANAGGISPWSAVANTVKPFVVPATAVRAPVAQAPVYISPVAPATPPVASVDLEPRSNEWNVVGKAGSVVKYIIFFQKIPR